MRWVAFICVVMLLGPCLAACAETKDDLPHSPTPHEDTALPPLAELQADLHSHQPHRVGVALARLSSGLKARDGDEGFNDYRALLATASADLWLYTRIAAYQARAGEAEFRDAWAEELVVWNDVLSIVTAHTPTQGAFSQDAMDRGALLSRALRPTLRPLFRDPVHRALAHNAIALFEAPRSTRGEAEAVVLGALRREAGEPLSMQTNTHLALEALEALDSLAGAPSQQHARTLALATSQFCDGVRDALNTEDPDTAMRTLRSQCGFACTRASTLGDDAIPLAPLTPSAYASCPASEQGLSEDTEGHYLGVANFLAIASLQELARIDRALRAEPSDAYLRRTLESFYGKLHERLQGLVIAGHLPFIGATGPAGITLPTQEGASTPLPPSKAIVVVTDGGVRVAAWPRFGIHEGEVRPQEGARFAFPGALLQSAASPHDPRTRRELEAALAAIDRAPWPATSAAEVVTLIANGDSSFETLAGTLLLLRAAGVEVVQLATWPHGKGGASGWSVSGVAFRIAPPPPRTPRLFVADGTVSLYDTLGRPSHVPIVEVRRFLPDIYAAVARYAQQNPALRELVVEPSQRLDLNTLVALLDSLRVHRSGDVMASSEKLLSAPAATSMTGPIALFPVPYLSL